MNRLILLFIVCVHSLAFGQEEKTARRLKAIAITLSPEYCYRDLNYSGGSQWIEETRDDEEVGNFGFNGSLLLQYNVQRKLKLEVGLSYANRSYRTKNQDLIWSSYDPALPSRSRTVYRFKYIGIPVNVRYVILRENKLRFSAAVGVLNDLFLSKKTKVIAGDYESSSVKQVGNSKFNLLASVRTSVDYQFTKRLSARFEPYYQRSLNSVIEDSALKEYLYTFGIAAGLLYSL